MAAKTDVAGRRIKTKGEPALANYADKDIPAVINDFVEFLKAETGVDVDPRSIYLGSALRGTFQKSEGNQKRLADRAVAIEQEKADRIVAREERAANKLAREAARKEKAAAAAEDAKAAAATAKLEKAAPKAPAKKTGTSKATPAKKAAAPAAPARRRAARAATKETESDF